MEMFETLVVDGVVDSYFCLPTIDCSPARASLISQLRAPQPLVDIDCRLALPCLCLAFALALPCLVEK
jgi:hypothetical protein